MIRNIQKYDGVLRMLTESATNDYVTCLTPEGSQRGILC